VARPVAAPSPGEGAGTLERLRGWFGTRGWRPLPFQEATWSAWRDGRSGLVHVPTGAGKTYAAALAPLAAVAEGGGHLLYVSPLRAMSRDIESAVRAPVDALELGLRVEARTGDTPSHVRARQRRDLPHVLVTTPESLALLLTEPDAPARFARLRGVVVDEWHELLDSKRGSLLELGLARLRGFAPGSRTWALSATLSNVEEAARAAVGVGCEPVVIRAELPRPVVIETLLPPDPRALPWAGHLGVTLLPALVRWLDPERSTLVFVNTRAQAEQWYAALTAALPGVPMGLHHGSVEREAREAAEAGLKDGSLKLVVATASLDLGVDLAPVERVVQIGSPKGLARLLQRAGRSGHRPGETCRILCVPTHALQLVEIAAARDALERGEIEPRRPMRAPLDVLGQHLVSSALGGGWSRASMYAEVRTAWGFRDLSEAAFDAALAMVREGGRALRAYPQFRKLVADPDGVHRLPDPELARFHRLTVGTIVGDVTMMVRMGNGASLGSIDEGFIARLSPGARFLFAGRLLELVRVRDLTAWVRPATRRTGVTPHWPGTRLPISGTLGAAVRRVFEGVRDGRADTPELVAARFLFEEQARLSRLPGPDSVMVERCRTAEGWHAFVYPFEGRAVHEGLAALIASRWGRRTPVTFTIAVNDYGFELLSPTVLPWEEVLGPEALRLDGLVEDVLASVNHTELARRRFRDVARIAGFVHPGQPWAPKGARQLQVSTGLLFDVLVRHDPEHLLVVQARREVIEQHFEEDRLARALARLSSVPLEHVDTPHPSPLAFPLVIERLSVDGLSTEAAAQRLQRLRETWTSS